MHKENILYKAHQHKIVLFTKIMRLVVISFVFAGLLWLISESLSVIVFLVLLIAWTIYHYILWKKSYIVVTNIQISLRVRNFLFSEYQTNLPFDQIKDTAYSKNNVLHFLFNYWTFFARPKREWDKSDHAFILNYVTDIENFFDIVNRVFYLKEENRDKLSDLSQLNKSSSKTREELVEFEKNNLLSIKWIVEVFEISKEDKKYIFENEEDRNHWVYETIKRNIVFCATHDDIFRDPDSSIVHKIWSKVIFPAVGFHEIEQKNVVSCSPWMKVHEYLIQNLKHFSHDDATLLIGFDI